MDQKLRLDIRIIKFQDYIRRKPDRPFGYCGLGIQYLLSDMPGMADKMFTQALKKNPDYVPAKLGKLEALLYENKFVAAARYYRKNSETFLKKKIYIKYIHKMVSNVYSLRSFSVYLGKLRNLFVFDEKIGSLHKMFGKNNQDPVVSILLAMYYLKKNRNDDRSLMLYNMCVGMEGITDRLRWDLLQAISKKQPAILKDTKIAGLFGSIPEYAYGTGYADLILSCFMAQQDTEKIAEAFSEPGKRQIMPGKRIMWEYINYCSRNNVWNSTVASYCQHLLENGWINSFLSQTAIQLKNKGIVGADSKMFKILSLYGYYDA